MRTLEEYVAMIPAAPPADIDRYLDALGRKPLAITSYRCISRDDAESRLDCEDFRADLRPSAAIRPAALWCSECESWYLAEYVPAYAVPCSPNLTYQNNSGVQVVNVEFRLLRPRPHKLAKRIDVIRDGKKEAIDLTENDLVFITNGGCVENSSMAARTSPPRTTPSSKRAAAGICGARSRHRIRRSAIRISSAAIRSSRTG